jgi:hypothetical protein
VLRLAVPALFCAALLWWPSGAESRPRAAREAGATNPFEFPVAAALVAEEVPALRGEAAPDDAGDGQAGPPEPGPPERAVLRQHDVRDLVAIGFRVEEIARWARDVCKDAEVTTRVNAVEMIAPEDAQIGYERLLDEKRRSPCVLRIHPVADLVWTREEWTALQEELADGIRAGGYDPPGGGGPAAPEDEAEPAAPFDIEDLAEVIAATLGDGVVSIDVAGVPRCLLVHADPAAQVRIGRFLDDLRSTTEAELEVSPK